MNIDDEVRLSPSIAKVLLEESPAHAYAAHSKLGKHQRKSSPSMVKGKAIDRLVFGVGPAMYLTKGKKDPELLCDAVNDTHEPIEITDSVYKEACDCAASVLAGMHERGIVIKPEWAQQKLYWTSNGVKCKAIADLVDTDKQIVYDLKSAASLDDDAIVYSIEKYGYDVQAAAELEALGPGWTFKWLFVETGYVNDFRVIEPDNRQIGYGTQRWLQAVTTWKKCLETGKWPGRADAVLGPSRYRDAAQAKLFEEQIGK